MDEEPLVDDAPVGDPFSEPDGDEDFEGEGGGGGSSLGAACCAFCIGLFLFPLSLAFTGWNEHRTVCRSKAIIAAEDQHIDLMCDSTNNVMEGDLGFLDCDLNISTFKKWTENDFRGLEGMTNLFDSYLPAVGVQMTVEMMTCKEKCVREEQHCHRRLDEESGDEDVLEFASADVTGDEADDDAEGGAWAGEQAASFPRAYAPRDRNFDARFLSSSSSSSKSCSTVCVEYGYWMEWSGAEDSSAFHDVHEAQRTCGAMSNPKPTGYLRLGSSTSYSPAGSVTTLGGGWRLDDWQLDVIPVEDGVTIPPSLATTATPSSGVQPPSHLDNTNAFVENNMVHSCDQLKLGCIRVSFKRSYPQRVMVLGRVSDETGLFDKEGWIAPDDWLCSDWDINRMCPMDSSLSEDGFNIDKGSQVCGETESKDAFFDEMHEENTSATWVYRIVGFILCWLSCCLVFSPISTLVTMATDFVDNITECIPGIGCLVDQVTDAIVGTVQVLICGMTCMISTSCFLTVMAITWVVMRPLYGIILSTASICFCCCAAATFQMMKKDKPRRGRSRLHSASDESADDL